MSFAIIKLTQGKFAIVDPERYQALSHFHWRAVKARCKWYAKTTIVKNGIRITICMHRFIARTPFGMVCHHKNSDSLDNRACNLENLEKRFHNIIHQNNRISVKFEATPTIKLTQSLY